MRANEPPIASSQHRIYLSNVFDRDCPINEAKMAEKNTDELNIELKRLQAERDALKAERDRRRLAGFGRMREGLK